MEELHSLRRDYDKAHLSIDQLLSNPFEQFNSWLLDAKNSDILEVNAMTLSTVSPEGMPSARIVLLKEIDSDGFIFYTNYESRKASHMLDNPHVALLFFWDELQRQVRIEGRIEKVSSERSTKYFQGRPKGSQIGAWVSRQSTVLEDREEMEKQIELLEAKYKDASFLPKPDNWGGYKVFPHLFEFWQGRSNRVHDRFQYQLADGDSWQIDRLAP